MVTEFSVMPSPAAIRSQRNHIDVHISYKLIGLVSQTSY